MILRAVAWPMGFMIIANGAQWTFLWTELAATTVHVGLAGLPLVFVGLDGAGVAFVGLYLWHNILIYIIVRRRYNFRWTKGNVVPSMTMVVLSIWFSPQLNCCRSGPHRY